MSVLTRVDALRSGRTPFVLATVVRAERPTSAKPGDRALVLPDGSMEGFVGGTCAESTVRLQGLRLLATGESTLLRITPTAVSETVAEGLVTVGNPCLSGGSLDIFLEAMLPPMLVHVHGDAPVARALVEIGRALGHDVRRPVLGDPAPDDALPDDLGALIVASHGRDEEPVLVAALRAGVPYVGLVASRRRGQAVLASLEVSESERARVHTPAGLDIGARTPPEVALSVYAELISSRVWVPAPGEPVVLAAEAVDPVCGMTVAVSETALSLVDEGVTVYFCGPGCRAAYADAPERYRP
ncbi:MAG: YHS domain-containing protein [Actinophytocola sp.]|uniref:XdhC family protein n=1 Tax=Actinophytocola sp. TaxID=1872138 RepID=UPI00132CB2CD|nr:XdhC family protein [Actinophytocola sp.]MPZ82457.1 YHS domain-containing protein [Actinophytocola sp.]